MKWKTLEQYLRDNSYPNTTAIDHSIRVEIFNDYIKFYIHPSNCGGDTMNYVLRGNLVEQDPDIIYPEE